MDPLLLDSPNTNYSNYTPSFTDDLVFILNNLVDDNLEAKLPAIRSIFFQGGWPFVEQFVPYFVLRRIAYEANRHLLYFRMLSGLDLPTFHTTLFEPVLLFTTKAFKVYLENEAKSFDTHERSVLKNLGSWLGLITFPRNRFLNIDSPDEINFIEVLGKERGDVLSIMIPAVCQFVSFADLKNPKNPSWVQELLRGLELCVHIADLGMKAKFEIEAVFAKVGQPLMLGSPVECSPFLPPDEKVKQSSASPIPAPDFETKGIFSPLDNNGNLSKNERQISLSVRKVFNLSIEQCESIGTAFSDFTILHSLPPILNADAYKFLVVHSMQMIIDSASFKAKEAIEKLANSAESPVAGNIKTIQNYFNDLLFRPVSLAITQYLTKQTFEQCLRTNLEHYIFQCKVILPHDSIEAIISNLTIYNLTNVLEYSANVVCKEVVKMIGKLAQDLCARNDGKYSTHNLYARYLLPQNADCFNYFRGSINPENFRFAMPGFSQNDDHLIFRNLGAFSTNLANICNDLKGFVNTAMTAHKDHYFFELGKLVQTFLSSEPKTVQIIKKFVSTTIFFVLTAHNVSSSIVHKDKSQLIATFHHIMDILLQNFSDKFIREITTGVVLQHSDVGIVNQEVFLLLFKKQCINCAEVDRVIVDKMQRRDASAREFARFLQKTFGPQRVDEFFQGFPGVYNFLVTTLREF